MGLQLNVGLHLLRGLCAMGVALYHFLEWSYGVDIQSMGSFFVYIFFVLSALTMMMVHGREFSASIARDGALRFYGRRCARILPLLALLALVSALRSGHPMAYAQGFLTGTALFGLQMPGLNSNVVAAWSLGIEAVFYLVFPLIALLCSTAKLRTLLLATALLVAGQQAAIFLIAGEEGAAFFFQYTNPLVFAPFFALGILIFRTNPVPERYGLGVVIVALPIIIASSFVFTSRLQTNTILYLALTALAAISVAGAYAAEIPRAGRRVAIFLGEISYALYLTHYFSYRVVAELAERLGIPEWLRIVAFFTVAVTAAVLVYRLVERPAQKFVLGLFGIRTGK